jgi:DNA invertase Pin-like site-specific DNA recombinase
MKIVAYLRVSTARQSASGLGLEAQTKAINEYVVARRAKVIGVFREVESGRLNSRPELTKALHLCKVTGATLLISKLDRLSRNAAFLLTLRDSGAKFIAADMPDANDLTVGVMALVAQQEREAISKRTREALAAAKARGVKLGNPNGSRALRKARTGNAASILQIRAQADERARDLGPIVEDLRNQGIMSLGRLSQALNERGLLTPRGGRWHKSSVRLLLQRLGRMPVDSRAQLRPSGAVQEQLRSATMAHHRNSPHGES